LFISLTVLLVMKLEEGDLVNKKTASCLYSCVIL